MNQKGFTLIEAVVAMSIAAIAIVALFKLNLQTISAAEKTKFYATAPMLAKIKLAELKMKSPRDATDFSGNFGEDFPGYQWTVEVAEVVSDIVTNMAESHDLDATVKSLRELSDRLKHLKRIDIKISGFNSSSYKLRTYLFLYEKAKKRSQ